ncbi:hypothetical protein [Parazoarcus communis]|nr:hypothetical protein [Parazoarcus communis]NMG72712.1 hypothetical protein [Parazoarcus communis SWub3 = DSM 12120]
MLTYQQLDDGEQLPFRQVGFGIYSQHDEDGILVYIFSRIGVRTCKAVEMCAGTGDECNVANLLINHRWTGLLVDGNPKNVDLAREFYRRRTETMHWPPTILHAWITRANVNKLLLDAGYDGEIDLLSLDVDGVDYWLWEAMTVITPRVVVLEYNHLLGPDVAVTVPYRDDFVAEFTEFGSDYAGASLAAFIKLGRRKGYRYVGSNTIGTNAFFVRDDVPCDALPEADPHEAFMHPRVRFGMEVRHPGVKDKRWVEV